MKTAQLLWLAAVLLGGCAQSSLATPPIPYSATRDTVTLANGAPQYVRFSTHEAKVGAPVGIPLITGRVTTVEALTTRLFAPIPGRVLEVQVRLGDRLKKGDKVVSIRSAELPSLQHSLRAASLAVATKQAVLDRTRRLVAGRGAAENDLTIAESELAEAKLAEQAARAHLTSLAVDQVSDDTFWLLAPRAGTVVSLGAEPGQVVGPDKDSPLATFADLDEVLVIGDLSPRDADGVKVGAKVDVMFQGSGDTAATGTLETISEIVDPERQTVPVRVRVDNKQRLFRPNSYVELRIEESGRAGRVIIPASAVISDGVDSVVFVEEKPGVYRRRALRIGGHTADQVEVTAGLTENEKVVTTNALLLLNALDVEG